MFSLFKKKKKPFQNSVSFFTNCWENDWKKILLDEEYLAKKQIANHGKNFDQKILIINNVKDIDLVSFYAQKKVEEKVLTNFFVAKDYEKEVLENFKLKRDDFTAGSDAHKYDNVNDDWVFYNAIAPLTAIYLCQTDYLLYMTGDSFLQKKIEWIDLAIKRMQKTKNVKVANLCWNEKYEEAKKESYKKKKDFFLAKRGFSDQFFLVAKKDFKQPIYQEIREDANHFPRGDVFEKRVFSYMINHKWRRITYRHGSYMHENI